MTDVPTPDPAPHGHRRTVRSSRSASSYRRAQAPTKADAPVKTEVPAKTEAASETPPKKDAGEGHGKPHAPEPMWPHLRREIVRNLIYYALILTITFFVGLYVDRHTPDGKKRLDDANRVVATALRRMQPMAVASRFYRCLLGHDRGIAIYQWHAPMDAATARVRLAHKYPRLTLTCTYDLLTQPSDFMGPDGVPCRVNTPETPPVVSPLHTSLLDESFASALSAENSDALKTPLSSNLSMHFSPQVEKSLTLKKLIGRMPLFPIPQSRAAHTTAAFNLHGLKNLRMNSAPLEAQYPLSQSELTDLGAMFRKSHMLSTQPPPSRESTIDKVTDAQDQAAYAAALRRIDRLVLVPIEPPSGSTQAAPQQWNYVNLIYTVILALPDAYLKMVGSLLPRAGMPVRVALVTLALLAAMQVGKKDYKNGLLFLLVLPLGVSLAAGLLSFASWSLHAAVHGRLTWSSLWVTCSAMLSSFVRWAMPEVVQHQTFESLKKQLSKRFALFAEKHEEA